MKLRNLHIENYKMFKDFDISFVDKNNEALPIVVLAGVNGSGKTSLLEFIQEISSEEEYVYNISTENEYDEDGNVISIVIREPLIIEREKKILTNINKKYFPLPIIYLSAGQDKLSSVEQYIVREYIIKAEKEDSFKKSLSLLQKDINDILKGLKLNFKIFKVDYIERKVFFENDTKDIFGIEELSTGEKTLLSKILDLYFKGYKDKVILIDEPELSLHPLWQKRVLKIYENFAKKNNCQIIIATHSPHIIASAKNKYLRFLVKEDNKIVVKQLTNSPLDRDTNTILKTIMGANYIPKELEELHLEYRKLVDSGEVESQEAKKVKEKILEFESPNSSFFQGIAFDLELM